MYDELVASLRALVRGALAHAAPTPALLLHDGESALSRLLTAAYAEALPHAKRVDVGTVAASEALEAAWALPAGALVVLVQSTRFDLGVVRFRLALFRRGLAVVEHAHLARIPEAELPIYAAAMAWDPDWYLGMGGALMRRIDAAERIAIRSAHGELVWRGPFEPSKPNLGDYRGAATVGGQYPIGEVFTEPVDLEGLDGDVAIAAFGADDFSVRFPAAPFVLRVVRGRVVDAEGAPAEFHAILDAIATAEGEVQLRELGFGLNRAMSLERRLHDVSAFERMCGPHLSLGAKHAVYPKPGKRHARFHVDVFPVAERVEIDGAVVFEDGAYVK